MSDHQQDEYGGDQSTIARELSANTHGWNALRSLKIPAQPLVYCQNTHTLVQVANRDEAVGLCKHQEPISKLYLTSDEIYAVQNSEQLDFHHGFIVMSTPNMAYYQEYGIDKRVVVPLGDNSTFQYDRNFEIPKGGFTYFHNKLGYLHDSEVEMVQERDSALEEDSEGTPAKSAGNNNRHLFPASPSLLASPGISATSIAAAGSTIQHLVNEKVKILYLTDLTLDAIRKHRTWKLTDTANQHTIEACTSQSHKMVDDLLYGRGFVTESGKYLWYFWTFDEFYTNLQNCFKSVKATSNVQLIKKNIRQQASHDPCADTSIKGYINLSRCAPCDQ